MRQLAFRGLRKYQELVRPAPPEPPLTVASAGSAKLLRYGRENGRAPVIFIPSLINPPRVLDLSESRSMLRHMVGAGHDAYLIDWGHPSTDDAHMGLGGHVTDRLLPMLAALPRPPILVGYCLGGSLALGAATLTPVNGVATIAAPWQFDGFPAADRELIASLWASAKPTCQRLGYVPMEVLQSGFWALDPARTIQKYAAFASMDQGTEAERAFLAVEDWANGGAPLSFAAGQDLFEKFYAGNVPGQLQWKVGGQIVNPAALSCPTLSVRSSTDRIVPEQAGPTLTDGFTLGLGHVGMIVGGKARDLLWDPLSEWLFTHGG